MRSFSILSTSSGCPSSHTPKDLAAGVWMVKLELQQCSVSKVEKLGGRFLSHLWVLHNLQTRTQVTIAAVEATMATVDATMTTGEATITTGEATITTGEATITREATITTGEATMTTVALARLTYLAARSLLLSSSSCCAMYRPNRSWGSEGSTEAGSAERALRTVCRRRVQGWKRASLTRERPSCKT